MSTIVEEYIPEKIDLKRLQTRTFHLVVFGHGNVGGEFLDQIHKTKNGLAKRRNVSLKVIAVANSKTISMKPGGLETNWKDHMRQYAQPYSVNDVIEFVTTNNFDNLIAIDNTADKAFTDHYGTLIANGFHIVSSNKHKNTQPWETYQELRSVLKQHDKSYYYETNVGAGLPLIDTIKLLHLSGENITRIRGVFSGSLSFLFNEFSKKDLPFSVLMHKAMIHGYTEPDPREDLSGMDVARKLLILARELDLHVNLEDVEVQNLVPQKLRALDNNAFLNELGILDVAMLKRKKNLKEDNVLRYIGDLHGDLSREDGAILQVNLQEIPKNSMLGQLKGSDSIFEIYTESYGANPIIIQGAGAGAAVTARGVYGDVLRICNQTL